MPRIERASPWEQIAEHYRQQIRDGALRSGEAIPATRKLAEEWGVANATAFRAVKALATEGWIKTRPGKSAVVAEHPPTR